MLRLLLAAAVLLAVPAHAVMPSKTARGGKRYGLEQRAPAFVRPTMDETTAAKAVADFNVNHPGGLAPASAGYGVASAGAAAAAGEASAGQLAPAFFTEMKPMLGIDPQQLRLLRETRGPLGDRHALYQQVHKGLPVEFSRVKIHFDPQGKVMGVDSNFRPRMDVDVRPLVGASVALYTVKQDLGEEPRGGAELVIVLDPKTALPRLAWKITAVKDGRWRYFVDAHGGEIVLRYDDLRYACNNGQAEGRVKALVYPIDQDHGTPIHVPVPNQFVYINPTGTSTHTITLGTYDGAFDLPTRSGANTGKFCFDNVAAGQQNGGVGKVYAFLQGPYVRVANFRGGSAFYENALHGSTSTIVVNQSLAATVSSPHPYSNNLTQTNSVNATGVITSTFAVAVRPVFTNFNSGLVTGGAVGEAADIADDDQVTIFDPTGYPVGQYVGNRGGFNGPWVNGKQFTVRLKSNAEGTNYGYDIPSVQYLALNMSNSIGTADTTGRDQGPSAGGFSTNGSFHWVPSSFNVTGLRAEAAAFVHLNQMRDYFFIGRNNDAPNKNGDAGFTPVSAMVLMGPNLLNAFYDPDFDGLYFGDVNTINPQDSFTDDATVTRHEYTHYVMQKIWNIQNFGEAGAISEAVADYFALSSLDEPGGTRMTGLGAAVNAALGGSGPLRQLDWQLGPPQYKLINGATGGSCGVNCTNRPWGAEIHDDSLFISQALWDIRRSMIADSGIALGFDRTQPANGIACADNLIWNAMRFFPESFFEFRQALRKVAKLHSIGTYLPSCGAGVTEAEIVSAVDTAFSNHAIPAAVGDAYDQVASMNNGFETAVDISEIPTVTATVFPSSDNDFYTFPAGPGEVKLELALPADGDYFKGYMMTIYDRNHTLLTQAQANYNGIDTNGGFCASFNCTTTNDKIIHEFNNPSSQQLYIQVSGGPSDNGLSNSGVQSSSPYVLKTNYQKPGVINHAVVSATLDNDLISYEVAVTTWFINKSQDFRLSYLQLRDHAFNILPQTQATNPVTGGNYLQQTGAVTEALGKISGQVRIQSGFNARFPSLGTVHLEVFGYNVFGSTYSLGYSAALNLGTDKAEAKVWNNVFNPATGGKTTLRYDIKERGHLTARLYTINGTFIATLFDGEVEAGKGSLDWRGLNASGSVVSSGIYLLHIQGPGIKKTQKIAVIK